MLKSPSLRLQTSIGISEWERHNGHRDWIYSVLVMTKCMCGAVAAATMSLGKCLAE